MKTTKKAHILLTAVAVALIGCATTNIVPQYVNPTNYQGHDCNLLQSEVARISQSAKATKTKIPNCLPQVLALVLWVVVAVSIHPSVWVQG